MFARTDCQEKFLVLNLEIQSCDNVAAVRQVGTNRSSDLKSRYFIRSRVRSGISDFKVLSNKSATGLILLHLSRACSMSSNSPAVHCTHRGGRGIWHIHSVEPILSWKNTVQHFPFICGIQDNRQFAFSQTNEAGLEAHHLDRSQSKITRILAFLTTLQIIYFIEFISQVIRYLKWLILFLSIICLLHFEGHPVLVQVLAYQLVYNSPVSLCRGHSFSGYLTSK